MPKFSYRAKNQAGKTIAGTIDALDQRAVSVVLRNQGLFVVDIQSSFSTAFVSGFFDRFRGKADFSEITNLTRQIAVMISTGLTITEALAVLRNQTHNQRMQKLLEQLIVAVEGGASFSKALSRYFFIERMVCFLKFNKKGLLFLLVRT